jgi:uncharacterized protein (TIGR03435 family)
MSRYLIITCLSLRVVFAQSFEVASIKPAAPMQDGRIMIGAHGGPGTDDPGQMTFNNISIGDLVQSAYDVKGYQVTGPDWLQTARFDVNAKVPAGTTKEDSRIMLQHLLADRFKLVLHRSSKEASIYALVVAKGGPKLKASTLPEVAPGGPPRGMKMMVAPNAKMRIVAEGATISKLIDALGLQVDRPIVDMTGLTGKYDITLEFAPDQATLQAKMAAMGVPPPPPGGVSPTMPDDGPMASLFTALPEQLGLRLEARKGPVELLVIDSVEKTPTDN